MAFKFAAAVMVAALALPAAAQDRGPVQRQALSDLSATMGQSHALRRTCGDPEDLYWFSRMERLLELEAPEAGLKTRLILAFNRGYQATQVSFPSCTPAAKAEAARTAARGQALAARLASP